MSRVAFSCCYMRLPGFQIHKRPGGKTWETPSTMLVSSQTLTHFLRVIGYLYLVSGPSVIKNVCLSSSLASLHQQQLELSSGLARHLPAWNQTGKLSSTFAA